MASHVSDLALSGEQPSTSELLLGKAGLAAVTAGDWVLLVGGHDGERPLKHAEVFQPAEEIDCRGLWQDAPPMLARRAYLSANNIDNRLYVVGGGADGRSLNTMEVFDVETAAWDSWFVIPPMHTKRTMHSSAYADGKLYVVGGFDGIRDLNALEVYDPEFKTWQWKLNMQMARSYLSVTAVSGSIYAIGGQNRRQTAGPRAHGSVEVFDLFSELWSQGPALLTPRLGLASAVLVEDGEEIIYVCGGSDGGNVLSSMEKLNPKEGKWVEAPPMKQARLGHAIAVVNNRLYVFGGYDGLETLDTFQCYDPAKKQWGPLLLMGEGREEAATAEGL
eukprot:TRINITY_DN5069_c0_g1_i1.p1 TRINITY_DN5069_c0_g1~~TRINITY_DN5069_c0_g1_i1.p1  ORF type:complete len:333 (+),score=86.16 TRINITY_DN5069_c0_g1_i1:81-1079(+)